MGLLDDYSGEGGLSALGMTPRPAFKHQLVMRKLLVGLSNYFGNKYEVLCEWVIDPNDLNSKVPDIIVYDKKLKPVMFIEITKTSEKKKIEKKASVLMEQYNIYESFIYDYETKEFNKLTGLKNFSLVKSYSDIFKIDLKQFV